MGRTGVLYSSYFQLELVRSCGCVLETGGRFTRRAESRFEQQVPHTRVAVCATALVLFRSISAYSKVHIA